MARKWLTGPLLPWSRRLAHAVTRKRGIPSKVTRYARDAVAPSIAPNIVQEKRKSAHPKNRAGPRRPIESGSCSCLPALEFQDNLSMKAAPRASQPDLQSAAELSGNGMITRLRRPVKASELGSSK